MKCTVDLNEYDVNGSFCVPNRIMLTAVKELADQPLVFDVNLDDCSIQMNYLNGSYKIFGQKADEYPRLKTLEGEATTTTIPAEVLANNINRTIFACHVHFYKHVSPCNLANDCRFVQNTL